VQTDFGTDMSLTIIINYASQGPAFAEDTESIEVPPITCSPKDEDWSLELPAILGADDSSSVKIRLMETSSFASQFQYIESKNTLFIKKNVLKDLTKGYCCPNYDTEFVVAIELSSDDLGTSTSMFNFFVEAASDVSTFNPFEEE